MVQSPNISEFVLSFFQRCLKSSYYESIRYFAEKSRNLIDDLTVFTSIDLNTKSGVLYTFTEIQPSYMSSILESIKLSADNLSIKLDTNECDIEVLPNRELINSNGSAKPVFTLTVPVYAKVDGKSFVSFLNFAKQGGLPPDKTQVFHINSIANFLAALRQREEVEMLERKSIERFALYDALTGVMNRHSFYQTLSTDIAEFKKDKLPLSLLLIDIDEFKQINDTSGHAFGDMILRQVSSKFLEMLDEGDRMFRIGGDEFAVIMKTDKRTAFSRVQGILKEVANIRSPRVSLSGGLVKIDPESTITVDEAVRQADEALYLAKGSGKNQVLFFDKEETSDTAEFDQTLNMLSDEIRYKLREVAAEKLCSLFGSFDKGKVYERSVMIAEIAVQIGDEMELDISQLQALKLGAVLQDIGVVSIPDEILSKGEDLSPEEADTVRNHTVMGGRIVERYAVLRDLLPIVLYHHEWMSGGGFPFGLSGSSIPLGPRIIAVANAYFSVNNPWDGALSIGSEKNLQDIINGRGTKYDSPVVDALLRLIEKKTFEAA